MPCLHKNACLALFMGIFSPVLLANTGHPLLSLAGGYSQWQNHDVPLAVTNTETDTLHQTHGSGSGLFAIGLGYDYLLNSTSPRGLHDVLIGLTVYDAKVTSKGDVYQFGLASLNNFTYRLPIHSTRLMIDSKLSAQPWHSISPCLIAGLGAAWNRADYQDTPDNAMLRGIRLGLGEQLQLAWEAGVGAQYAINPSFALFAEYLYADAGHAKTLPENGAGAVLGNIPVQSNSVLLGINFSFNG